ncbi:UNKNOWN [Stylonychia lemnae]|uniref:Cyclin N-terminal domain-containing protein n=1 Tax=Stylonychia lemnae TaxID=5949 RepID=A0A078B0P2_STYLE|nr:UNKNOWN [Stylonychia lemnae]|eukprot:CDW86683.1 UNKNOWN [Stylonychia lemnae]
MQNTIEKDCFSGLKYLDEDLNFSNYRQSISPIIIQKRIFLAIRNQSSDETADIYNRDIDENLEEQNLQLFPKTFDFQANIQPNPLKKPQYKGLKQTRIEEQTAKKISEGGKTLFTCFKEDSAPVKYNKTSKTDVQLKSKRNQYDDSVRNNYIHRVFQDLPTTKSQMLDSIWRQINDINPDNSIPDFKRQIDIYCQSIMQHNQQKTYLQPKTCQTTMQLAKMNAYKLEQRKNEGIKLIHYFYSKYQSSMSFTTLLSAIQILDKFLSSSKYQENQAVYINKIPVFAVTCLFISSKYWDVDQIFLDDIVINQMKFYKVFSQKHRLQLISKKNLNRYQEKQSQKQAKIL